MTAEGRVQTPDYFRVHTQVRQESGPGYVASIAPDPLWGCSICGAVITEDSWPLHDRWHATMSAPARNDR